MKPANAWISIGVVIGVLISARPALHAQPTSDRIVVGGDDKPWNLGVTLANREAARQLFLEGNRLFRVPLFARAAEQYTAALRTWKHPAFYFNLALAQLNLGQDVEARENLELALKQGEEPLGAEEFHEAQKQLQDVEHQLGRIRIRCQTRGAEVTLDGVTLHRPGHPAQMGQGEVPRDHRKGGRLPVGGPARRGLAGANPGRRAQADHHR